MLFLAAYNLGLTLMLFSNLSHVGFFALGAFACVIGALPLGLVNLNTMNLAMNTNIKKAMQMAHGAALVEVLFVILAVFLGRQIDAHLIHNNYVAIFIVFVLLVAAIYFYRLKPQTTIKQDSTNYSYGKGALLNLVSIQVFLYWLLVITILAENNTTLNNYIQLSIFIVAVYLAKIAVLWSYAYFGKRILKQSTLIGKNINRIIAACLFIVALIQTINHL